MNSQCRENKDLIADLVTGIMPQEQAKQVHDHLDTCPSCREYTLTLQSQEERLRALFAGYNADMAARENQVIGAIDAFNVPSGWTIRSLMARIADSSVNSRAAAAVVIAVVALYFIVTMTWISQITEYMKMGTECIRLSSGA